jgi:excisionase family DNA binding protein
LTDFLDKVLTNLFEFQTVFSEQRSPGVELQTKIPEQEELLTVDEVRLWLRLGRTRLNELLQSGELPSFKVGRRRFIRRGDALEWLEQYRFHPREN